MDTDFWDEVLAGLSLSDLDWSEIRIRRRKESMNLPIIARKIIIRKTIDD
jgi:hypothetical protein